MIKANRVLAGARRDAMKTQREPGETEDMERATDDQHEPFSEDHEMWEEPNQHWNDEMEDPFGHLQHNLDEDLCTTSSATEHSEQAERPCGSTFDRCYALQQQPPALQASQRLLPALV